MCVFCTEHLAHATTPFQFTVVDSLEDIDNIDDFGSFEKIVMEFHSKAGAALYTKHAVQKMTGCVAQVMQQRVDISIVHVSVLGESSVDKTLTYLVKSPTVQDLTKQELNLKEMPNDASMFASLGYNKALTYLQEFAEVIDLKEVTVPGAAHPELPAEQMDVENALFYLKLVCLSRDLCVAAAHVHAVHMVREVGCARCPHSTPRSTRRQH